MPGDVASLFLDVSARLLPQMTDHLEACFSELSDEQLWDRGASHENAVGNLILHLCGNVQQWIISGVGGAPDTRDRDAEFAANGEWSREQLLAKLRATVDSAVGVMQKVTAERLMGIIHVQGRTVSVLEAIYHVTGHFQQHTGQIIFATKLMSGQDLNLVRPSR